MGHAIRVPWTDRAGDMVKRPGRPMTLDATQWATLGRALRREPQTFGHAGHLGDGKLLSAHLRLRYGVKLGVRQCQRIFGHMGFRLRKPTPQVAQSTWSRSRCSK